MTEEQKVLLDKEIGNHIEQAKVECYRTPGFECYEITFEEIDFIAEGTARRLAQSILSDPGKWGLIYAPELLKFSDTIKRVVSENDKLQAENQRLKALMQEFVDRVGNGEIWPKDTYAKFKQALEGLDNE